MGSSKRKSAKPPLMRSRTTRSKGKALSDPAENSQLLNEQLRAMGLYAADTLGDGNCLFRALSDQLYGTPSYHLKLRQDICDWIESHKQRYEPFVDDERGLDVHLQCMRQPATYGGHLELSAFAHMTRRDVKVIQPGLVYVIEWAAGGDPTTETTGSSASSSAMPTSSSTAPAPADDRERRRLMRERRRAERERDNMPEPPQGSQEDKSPGPIYVAYHDWEHFSSIRNLRGPHTGLPNVVETPAPDVQHGSSPAPARKRPPSKAKTKLESRATQKQLVKTRVAVAAEDPRTPSQIPLPVSRSPSPLPNSRASPMPSHSELASSSLEHPRSYRSPKRTFDESSASSFAPSEDSQSAAKRAKSSSRATSQAPDALPVAELPPPQTMGMQVEEVDIDIDTPDLSVSGSSPAYSSSLSSVPSPAATPPPTAPAERRLTRRQRKALGLPKPRPALVGSATARTRGGAGRIVIPGGRFKKTVGKSTTQDSGADDEDTEASAEWRHNGTGRVDVRGFRELKI